MNEREAYIAMNMMERVGPVRVRALLEVLGSPAAIWDAPLEDLLRARGVGRDVAARLIEQRTQLDPAAEEAAARKLDTRIVTQIDDEYPEPLKTIHDPPLALYVRGTLEKKDRHAIALVGTRRASHYALKVSDRLAYQLGKVGMVVISGLARGVDTAAHRGALKAGGRTLAVLGSGMDTLYPAENRELADAIAKQGAVVTEFPLGTVPNKTTFPMRNRIVSGLSMGVVVVEASVNSGSLITADEAAEQGRSVFAVPGPIDAPGSKGAHRLIKQGARLVDDVSDILEEFELLISPEQEKKNRELTPRWNFSLNPDEQAVVGVLEQGATDVDTLARRANLRSPAVSSLLIGLEMKRIIRMLPGRRVELAIGVEIE